MTLPTTPTREEGGEELRMRAYYYGFDATGTKLVDRILSAVACAGKAFHHTESWDDECGAWEPVFRGNTPAEWIQNAANDAAAENARLAERVRVLEGALRPLVKAYESWRHNGNVDQPIVTWPADEDYEGHGDGEFTLGDLRFAHSVLTESESSTLGYVNVYRNEHGDVELGSADLDPNPNEPAPAADIMKFLGKGMVVLSPDRSALTQKDGE